MLTDM